MTAHISCKPQFCDLISPICEKQSAMSLCCDLRKKGSMSEKCCSRIRDFMESLVYKEKCGWNVIGCPRKRDVLRKEIYTYIRLNNNYQKVVIDIVKYLFKLYESSNTLSKEGKLHLEPQNRKQVIALATHLCEKFRIKEDELVKEVMKRLTESQNGNFLEWFEFLSPFLDWRSYEDNPLYPYDRLAKAGLLAGWTTHKHLTALNYFLSFSKTVLICVTESSHIIASSQEDGATVADCKTETTFKVPLVECPLNLQAFGKMTPLALACLTANEQAVLILLRHGAQPKRAYGTNGCKCLQHSWCYPINIVLNQLNLNFDDLDPNNLLEDIITCTANNQVTCYILRHAQCLLRALVYMMRATDHIQLAFTSGDDLMNNDKRLISMQTPEIYCIHERYVNCLKNYSLEGPRCLQHLCRITIRDSMHKLNCLPGGIFKLPLPSMLQTYLNLGDD